MPRNGGHLHHDTHAQVAAGGRARRTMTPVSMLPARTNNSDGHPAADTHADVAVAGGGQGSPDTHGRSAPTADDGGHLDGDTHPDITPIITLIKEHWRDRQDLHKAEKSLTNQIKGKCRRICGGDKKEAGVIYKAMMNGGDHEMAAVAMGAAMPFIQARATVNEPRKAIEKRLLELTKQLPLEVLEFVEQTRGFGLLGLASIIGETGLVSCDKHAPPENGNYPNPDKLNKRMGESVMPDGTRQRRVKGAAALEHGYSPSRHSVIWTIGEALIKANGDYKKLYDERKAYEHARDPEMSKGYAHNRAARYMRKRLLRELWRAWRRATKIVSTTEHLPAAGNDGP